MGSMAWVDVAQVAVVVVETAALGNEVHQQVRHPRRRCDQPMLRQTKCCFDPRFMARPCTPARRLNAQVQGARRSRLHRAAWNARTSRHLSVWNLIDVSASTCLIVGALCHFTRQRDGVQTVGALGVALKWMGFVDFLRAFKVRFKTFQ